MFSPSTAPRWKMATSTLRRAVPAASTVLLRNDGAKPRLTSASPPLRMKMRLEIMMTYLRWNSGAPSVSAVSCVTSFAFFNVSIRGVRDLALQHRLHQPITRGVQRLGGEGHSHALHLVLAPG